MWRWICFILAAIAIVFAVLQYNDPDWWLWGSYYLAVGLFAILSACGSHLRAGYISLVIGSVALMMMTAPGVYAFINNRDGKTLADAMSKEYEYIEETREFGGALVGFLIVTIAYAAASRQAVKFTAHAERTETGPP